MFADNPSQAINNLLRYLLIAFVVVFFLYVGKALFIPLLYGLFIAIVLYPVCKWLERKNIPRALAITFALSILFLLVALFAWIIVLQVKAFAADIPVLKQKLTPVISDTQAWLNATFHLSLGKSEEQGAFAFGELIGNPAKLLTGSIIQIASGFVMLFIIPVFAALFLYNRGDFVLFLEKLAGDKLTNQLHVILRNTITTYFKFIRGMIWVYAIVGLLNSLGLMALGIEHAFLFGFLTAIMTVIPYVGIFISALLPVTVAWVTHDSIWYPLGVVAVFSFVQYLEANVIFPRVVAAELNVSTWATLVAILAGGILWGVSGMILFIPLISIAKMVTDYIPEWEPLNILLRRNKST